MKHTLVPLGSVCSINPKSARYDDDFEVSFIPMQSVGETGTIDTSMVKPYFEVKKGYTGFIEGDVLFAKITPCMENGKGAIAAGLCNGVGYGSTEFHVLRPSESITAKWLYYLTSWDVFRKECERNMTGSAGQKRVPAKYLESYRVHVPSHSEQVRITTILDRICEQIRLHEEMLTEFDRLVKSRFIEMFGDPVSNPKGWPVQNFEDISILITDGEHATPRRSENGIYLLSARNVLNHTLQLDDVDFIDEDEYSRIARRVIPQEGDVLISCSGSIGRCCVVPTNLRFQMVRSAALIRFTDAINPIYAEWLITSDELQRQIAQSATQSSQANLFQGKIQKLHGYVPPKALQDEFALFVVQTDKSKFSLKNGGKEADFAVKCIWESLCRGTPT